MKHNATFSMYNATLLLQTFILIDCWCPTALQVCAWEEPELWVALVTHPISSLGYASYNRSCDRLSFANAAWYLITFSMLLVQIVNIDHYMLSGTAF